MELEKRLHGLVARELEMLGYELVKLDVFFAGRSKVVRIYIDRTEGAITLDDCVKVTKAMGFALDGEDCVPGPYKLEVSSPGIDRPLTRPQHYMRFRGKRACIEFMTESSGRETVIGAIGESDPEWVCIYDGESKRKIRFFDIIKANLQLEISGFSGTKRGKKSRRGKRSSMKRF